MAPKKKSTGSSSRSAGRGLPKLPPDAQEAEGQIDNIVPTRGYSSVPIVGLGGSAGSIAALQKFFTEMPAESGMAFVVVIHLSPEHASTLPELLAKYTKMPVMAVADGVKVTPNSVYVIPPGKHLSTVDGHLRLTDLEPEHGRRVAVDLFFRSLADTHGPHATAVVLSGADGDGAIGIKRIKERGGLTIAQEPSAAEHPSMPESAIATGMVDWVLPVSEIPARLVDYHAREPRLKVPPEEGPQPAQPPPTSASEDESALREVLAFLRARTGRDFSYYKRATIVRRISRRMQINALEELPAYLSFLRTHPGETGALLQDLLISVTNFFRDRDSFAVIEGMIPELFRGKGPDDTVRVWVPACATGEETYSMTMLLMEHAGTLDKAPAIQVFGCDLDENAVQTARAGNYPGTIVADVNEDRLRRFFQKNSQGYNIRREVREVVLFATHDLVKDAPFSRMDLISCRNIMIYLNGRAQARVLDLFHFALRPDGLLFLGSSESVEERGELFEVLDKRHRIYRRSAAQRTGLPVPSGPSTLMRALQAREEAERGPVLPGQSFARTATTPISATTSLLPENLLPDELHLRLIERLAPPSVLVNADHQIIHLSGGAIRFLQMVAGVPTANILQSAHPMLRADLRGALFQAAEAQIVIEHPDVPFEIVGKRHTVTIHVSPANELAPGFLLVIFHLKEGRPGPDSSPLPPLKTESGVPQLEREIEVMRRRLRDTAEQFDASTEELRASNEELQAMNEELRSASEELETSREELQSINEELSTVNGELKGSLDELGHANADLQNLMASTAIPIIFLDRKLCITRYTPSAVELFRIIPSDVGRPLADLRHQLEYPELIADVARVLDQLVPIEREVNAGNRWYLARLIPYRTLDDRIAGVVLALVDMTAAKLADQALRANEEQFRWAIEEAPIPVIMQAEDGQVLQISKTWTELTGYAPEDIPTFEAWVNRAYGPGAEKVREHVHDLFAGKLRQLDVEIGVETRGGEIRSWAFSASAPGRLRDGRRFIIGMALDISDRRRVEEALRQSEERFRLVIENAHEYAIFSMDLKRRITSWNSGAQNILGYSQAEILGEPGDIIFTSEDRAVGIPELEAQTALAKGRATDERWHVRKDKSRFWASGVMTPMHDARGDAVGLVKIFRDETEAKNAEDALKQSRAEAEGANRTKDRFLAMLSHELRTPLTPVLMAAESLLKGKDLPRRTIEGLQMICQNVELEIRLINELLDLTRISHGKFELKCKKAGLHQIIERAIVVTRPDIDAKQQRLSLKLSAAEDCLFADDERLQQVFWNLLKNASKFTPEHGEISVMTRTEGESIVVKIVDSGCGIPASSLSVIFEPFQQAGESVTREFGGLGLGLAIAKAIVEAHGGTIVAASEGAGRGTTMTLMLPSDSSESRGTIS